MITVVFNRKNSNVNSFELSGHACSGPYGYDLVCAAVSAVSFGSVNAALKLEKANLEIDQAGDGGFLSVSLPENLNEKKQRKLNLIFEAMLVSLQTIESEYAEHIQIIEN